MYNTVGKPPRPLHRERRARSLCVCRAIEGSFVVGISRSSRDYVIAKELKRAIKLTRELHAAAIKSIVEIWSEIPGTAPRILGRCGNSGAARRNGFDRDELY